MASVRVRVRCSACGWEGGRSATYAPTAAPCFKCGGSVDIASDTYVEVRHPFGCEGCTHVVWRTLTAAHDRPCPRCQGPMVPLTLRRPDGSVFELVP
jgi:Zn finger protein HypA/HybF involved in hydrogenase expression